MWLIVKEYMCLMFRGDNIIISLDGKKQKVSQKNDIVKRKGEREKRKPVTTMLYVLERLK